MREADHLFPPTAEVKDVSGRSVYQHFSICLFVVHKQALGICLTSIKYSITLNALRSWESHKYLLNSWAIRDTACSLLCSQQPLNGSCPKMEECIPFYANISTCTLPTKRCNLSRFFSASRIMTSLSVQRKGTGRLPPDGFWWKFIRGMFDKTCQNFLIFVNITQRWHTLHIHTYVAGFNNWDKLYSLRRNDWDRRKNLCSKYSHQERWL